jgi:pimeloyl-ACP methyl ester carboxylesterase
MSVAEFVERINGCATRFMRKGAGAPLIFLHGANGAPAWLPVMETLAARFDVIVPEHPGFGGSDMPEWLDNIGDLAFFYLDLIDHFRLEGVNLVGQSLGGWIAAELAARNDTKLNTLTLSAPAGIYVKGVPRTDVFMLSPEESVRVLVHDQAIADKMLDQPESDERTMTLLKNRLTTAKLAWQPRFYNPDLAKWLHRISVPTLILWGAEDRLVPPAYGPAYQALIPGAKLKVFPDCGHLSHVEKHDDYVEAVTSFIHEAAR